MTLKSACPLCQDGGGGELERIEIIRGGSVLIACDECDAAWFPGQIIRPKRFQSLSDFMEARGERCCRGSVRSIALHIGPASSYGDSLDVARGDLPHPIDRPDLDPMRLRPCPCCQSGLLCIVHIFGLGRSVIMCDACEMVWDEPKAPGDLAGIPYERFARKHKLGEPQDGHKEFIKYIE